MRIRIGIALFLAGAAAVWQRAASADAIEVRLENGAIAVRADGVPLAKVLERIAQATGIALRYEGAPPTQRVRQRLRRESATAAIVALLEGRDLSYVLQLDATGSKPERLIVFTNLSHPARSAPPALSLPEAEEPTEEEATDAGLEEPPASYEEPEGQALQAEETPAPATEGASPTPGPASPMIVVPLCPTPVPTTTPPPE